MDQSEGEILYIFVIGFHHKKGCQIEFSYPEIGNLPEEWRHLPSLAMPDGAHNFENDAVYFHLPNLKDDDSTIFGVSCFQQIPIEKVKNITRDMTRGTIQKAICILSTLPLFGYIQIKMELVTAAFFDKGDFSNVSLLKDAFHHLNDCLNSTHDQHLFDGLSVRDLVLKFRHRTLLLFKLLLLERRVIYFNSPVKPMCCTLLSLISLHPGQLDKGLHKSFSTKSNRPEYLYSWLYLACSFLLFYKNIQRLHFQLLISALFRKTFPLVIEKEIEQQMIRECESVNNTNRIEIQSESDNLQNSEKGDDNTAGNSNGLNNECSENLCDSVNELANGDNTKDRIGGYNSTDDSVNEYFIENYFEEIKSVETLEVECSQISSNLDLFPEGGLQINHDINYLKNLNLENYGLPLSVFTEGNLCLPYVSISYLDFLTSQEVKGFHGGAANLLFKQKKQLVDVLVELESSKIESSPELSRQLLLTTEDLRFGERLIRAVTDPDSCEADGPGKCNIEEWIRLQFTMYMLSLLRTSLMEAGSKELHHFNIHFINAWKNTRNYKIWLSEEHKSIWDLSPGHPFSGNLSVSDVRLRFSQAITNTESGRRINQAVTSTGKAVGGAITQARGALSHWWSSLRTPESKPPETVNDF